MDTPEVTVYIVCITDIQTKDDGITSTEILQLLRTVVTQLLEKPFADLMHVTIVNHRVHLLLMQEATQNKRDKDNRISRQSEGREVLSILVPSFVASIDVAFQMR